MFNYKKIAFIFIVFSFILIVTDSHLEKKSRVALLSLINVVVDESSEVGGNAPGSIVDSIESGRRNISEFFDKNSQVFTDKSSIAKSPLSIVFRILSYIFSLFFYLSSYVITFYPLVIYAIYAFFTSRFMRRDDFSSFNNY